ncbi:MAG: efflux RND transporter permease subunit [Bacteroidales bacterium]|nr:efflux RND transporter permease subunit [Bacteroidales bacterium]
MKNRQVTLLFVAVLFVSGVYSLINMPKQEMPEYTVRKGLVVGVYPGANSAQVEEQLTKPLERYLFTFSEIKRAATTSKTEDGICYIFVDLADNVKDNNIVWSKIKHGLIQFKSTLPTGVLAVAVNDNFSDVSAVLVTMEADDKTPRQIDSYCDVLEDRLHTIPDVSNVRRYGSQKEQITIYIDNEKLASYGIGSKTLIANLFTQGFTTTAGVLENDQSVMSIHIAETYNTEQDIADQIILFAPNGDVVRIKDIGRVVREYPNPDSYITHNGKQCVLLSIEVKHDANIITFGKEVNEVLDKFKSELPKSMNINQIVNQPEIVSDSINIFLRELLIAIFAVVLVIIILMPLRVSLVSALSIPITIAITFTVMYLLGIPLNFVTLAALMAVLGIIVDDSIVVVDNYIDKLDAGMNRWDATIRSVQEYFKSILSATLAISITFIPILYTSTGSMQDMITHFPWTICIALFASMFVGVMVIPIIQYFLIKKGLHSAKNRHFLDVAQTSYEKLLANSFRHPYITLSIAMASIVAAVFIFKSLPVRMMPIAERDQFAVEIYLPKGSPLEKTAAISDSVRNILKKDRRVKSISAFVGTSSPRFHFLYAPNMPSKSYAQLIVNTISNKATEEILDEYSTKYAFYFPESYVKFKQLDFQATEAVLEIRLTGDNLEDLKKQAENVETYLRSLDECLWVSTSFGAPVQSVKIELVPEETSRLGISKTLVSLGISSGLTGMKINDVWEGDYSVPVYIQPELSGRHFGSGRQLSVSDLGNVQISGLSGSSVPLRQIAKITPEWEESVITHRSGLRTITIFADLKRTANAEKTLKKIMNYADNKITTQLPDNITLTYGGTHEQDSDMLAPLTLGMLIAFVIMFFILVFHFKKLKLAVILMLSITLCVFGASFGVWILHIDFNAFAILGIIGLAGILVRNGIIMFDYIEYLRFTKGECVRTAAFEAGKRRMRPIFLTSAVAAMGVLPMIISQSPMWAGMASIMFFGTLITMVLIVTVLPILYYLLYRKHDKISVTK